MILLLIAVFLCIILYEVPGLIRNNCKRELAVFSVLLFIAFALSLAEALNIDIPNPVRETQYFVKNLLNLSYE